jgi:hypothetical protein
MEAHDNGLRFFIFAQVFGEPQNLLLLTYLNITKQNLKLHAEHEYCWYFLPFCTSCGKEYALGTKYCPNCGMNTTATAPQVTGEKTTKAEIPAAPAVSSSDVWIPIVLLILIVALGFVAWWLGVAMLIFATFYVHVNSRKFGVGGGRAFVTLLVAIVGLPLYAHDLHKLRQSQTST